MIWHWEAQQLLAPCAHQATLALTAPFCNLSCLEKLLWTDSSFPPPSTVFCSQLILQQQHTLFTATEQKLLLPQLLWPQGARVSCVSAHHLTWGLWAQSISTAWPSSLPWALRGLGSLSKKMHRVMLSASPRWGETELVPYWNARGRGSGAGTLHFHAVGQQPFSSPNWVPVQVTQNSRTGKSWLSITLSFWLGRPRNLLYRGGSLLWADVRGSQSTRESNPQPEQMLRASPLHLRKKGSVESVWWNLWLKHLLSTSHSCSGPRINQPKSSLSPWQEEVQAKGSIWSSAHNPFLPAPGPSF